MYIQVLGLLKHGHLHDIK